MVRAWYMDDDIETDQRQPHQTVPLQTVSLEKLKELNVLYFKIENTDWENDVVLSKIRKDHGYTYEDMITCSPDKLPNYEDKLKSFYKEHLHDDEEIRLITEGSGYFDVRDTEDKWIRIELEAHDMIILPAGIYHRFTLDAKNYVQAKRYFVGDPVWTPVNRPADEHDARKSYLASLESA